MAWFILQLIFFIIFTKFRALSLSSLYWFSLPFSSSSSSSSSDHPTLIHPSQLSLSFPFSPGPHNHVLEGGKGKGSQGIYICGVVSGKVRACWCFLESLRQVGVASLASPLRPSWLPTPRLSSIFIHHVVLGRAWRHS